MPSGVPRSRRSILSQSDAARASSAPWATACWSVVRAAGVSPSVEQVLAGLQQLFASAMTLGHRGSRPIDVGTRAGVVTIEEEDAGPDVNGVLVLLREVAVEAFEKERLDLGGQVRTPSIGA